MQTVEDIKIPLEKSDTQVDYLESIIEKTLSTSSCFECIIENYSDLKERTYYKMTQEVSGRECTLKLYKTEECHAFQFHFDLSNTTFDKQSIDLSLNKMIFHVMYDQYEPMCSCDLTETKYGYSIEVPNEVVLHVDNKYLYQKNILVVEFSHRNRMYYRTAICHNGIATKTDKDSLSDEFLSLYESGKFTDFVLCSTDGKQFHVHKPICKARSLFFRMTLNVLDYKDAPGMYVNSESRILEIAIRYMYSGKLEDTSLDDLLKIAGVAQRLGILDLQKSVTIALMEKLNNSNARKIKQEVKRLQVYDLFLCGKDYFRKDDEDENEEEWETEDSPSEADDGAS